LRGATDDLPTRLGRIVFRMRYSDFKYLVQLKLSDRDLAAEALRISQEEFDMAFPLRHMFMKQLDDRWWGIYVDVLECEGVWAESTGVAQAYQMLQGGDDRMNWKRLAMLERKGTLLHVLSTGDWCHGE
jgi:hypothetical protein